MSNEHLFLEAADFIRDMFEFKIPEEDIEQIAHDLIGALMDAYEESLLTRKEVEEAL